MSSLQEVSHLLDESVWGVKDLISCLKEEQINNIMATRIVKPSQVILWSILGFHFLEQGVTVHKQSALWIQWIRKKSWWKKRREKWGEQRITEFGSFIRLTFSQHLPEILDSETWLSECTCWGYSKEKRVMVAVLIVWGVTEVLDKTSLLHTSVLYACFQQRNVIVHSANNHSLNYNIQ